MAMAAATARTLIKKLLPFHSLLKPSPKTTFLCRTSASFSTLSNRPKCTQQKHKQKPKRSNFVDSQVKRRTRSDRELDEETFSKNYGNDNSAHVPVMLGEVLDVFASVPPSYFVDCTLCAAGHSSALKDYWKMKNKKQVTRGGSSTSNTDMEDQQMDIKSIIKDIEFLDSTHMTWKEKKELENKKVVSLGGKPPKKQRLPLSVARVVMKKQKDREVKMKEESAILGRFGSHHSRDSGKAVERRRPEKRVLKSSEGHFRNGVLDVKHLLQPSAPKVSNDNKHAINKGKKKKGGKKNHGKKGAGRRHR